MKRHAVFTALLLAAINVVALPAYADLLVSSRITHSVKRYDQSTGAYLGDFIAPGSGGLNQPYQLTYRPDGNLYVSDEGVFSSGQLLGQVLIYDGVTGAFIRTLVAPGSGGLGEVRGFVFDPDGNLFVSSVRDSVSSILRYDGKTGKFIGTFASGPPLFINDQMLFRPDGALYVENSFDGVLRYDGTTGAFIDTFIPSGSGGLDSPSSPWCNPWNCGDACNACRRVISVALTRQRL